MGFKKMCLDSGAYSAGQRKETLDIDQYMEFLTTHSDLIDSYINLDVLTPGGTYEAHLASSQQSLDNWKYMRSKGFNPIPVFHAGAPWEHLDYYLRNTDYIALGAIAAAKSEQRFHWLDEVWAKHLTDDKGIPICRVHAMGLSAVPMMFRYPWYSMDSTAFVKSSAYGKLYLPDYEKGKWVYDCNRVKVVTVSDRSALTTLKPDSFKQHEVNPHSGAIAELTEKYLKEEHGVTVEDIKGSFPFRACVNGRYFQKIRQTFKPYPWSFYETKQVRRQLPILASHKVDRELATNTKDDTIYRAELYFVISSVHSKWIWAVDDINQKEILSSYYFVRRNIDRFRRFVKGERDESYKKFVGYCD